MPAPRGPESFAAARARRALELELESNAALRRPMRFFFELEQAAHAADLAHAVDAVHAACRARLLERLRGEPPGADPAASVVAEVAGPVAGLLERHFPAPGGGADARGAFAALLRFGDGQLRSTAARPGVLQHHNGEPNGPEFLLFGELALLCLRAGVEPATWSRLAPALLGPQDVFCRRYSNGPPRYATGYRPVHYRSGPPIDPAQRVDAALALDLEAAIARSTGVGRRAFRLFPSAG